MELVTMPLFMFGHADNHVAAELNENVAPPQMTSRDSMDAGWI